MESKEQSGRKVLVKESIKYVSDLITGLGVKGFAAENLRLAKFNRLESPRCLLRALHGIVTLVTKNSDPSSTSRFNPRKEQLEPPTVLAALESVSDSSPNDHILGVVKFHLALWRYPPHSPFFTLHADTLESRHLLLALGWILSRYKLIDKGLERRLQPLLLVRSAAPSPHDYPLDTSSCAEALARAKKAENAVVDSTLRMMAASDRVEDEVLRTELRADQVLVLHGQVRACVYMIEALKETKVKKIHELQQAQSVSSKKHAPYELHLLQHRKKLVMHYHVIAAAKAIQDEKEACQKHEGLFWQWMESVAQEALALQAQSPLEQPPTVDLTGVREADLLCAIDHLKRKFASRKPKVEGETFSCTLVPRTIESESFKRDTSIEDICPSKYRTLPQHAKDIVNFLFRQPGLSYTPKKRPGTRFVKAILRDEEEIDAQSTSFRTQRLMELDIMVKGILTRTRADNKAVISEILKSIMDNGSYVVVGD